jgi:hypothetical protein
VMYYVLGSIGRQSLAFSYRRMSRNLVDIHDTVFYATTVSRQCSMSAVPQAAIVEKSLAPFDCLSTAWSSRGAREKN